MIVYGAGIADGNLHTEDNLPTLLLGGGAGHITSGRHIRYPKGTPMANLHLRMLDILGVPVDKLGDSTGKLDPLSV
jgi:hypothetical protein